MTEMRPDGQRNTFGATCGLFALFDLHYQGSKHTDLKATVFISRLTHPTHFLIPVVRNPTTFLLPSETTEKKQHILTFEELEATDVRHFCLKQH